MGTQTVGSIVAQVKRRILDESNDDFSDTQLLDLYNLANKKIVTLQPAAYTTIDIVLLAAGNKQSIPADGIAIMDVRRNFGTDGQTPGRVVRQVEPLSMQSLVPTWATDTQQAYAYDWWPAKRTEEYYVHPPSDGTNYVEIDIAKTPPATVWDAGGLWQSATSPLNDSYVDAQINGMMYQAYDDDTDIPGNTPRSALYYGRFLQALGITTGGQAQ